MHSKRIIKSPATVTPVTVAELKAHLRLESTFATDDAYLAALIDAAKVKVENDTNRCLSRQTYQLFLDNFPLGGYGALSPYIHHYEHCHHRHSELIELLPCPLISVSSVKYYDVDNAEQTLVENTDYEADVHSEPGRLVPYYGMVWPDTYPRKNAVTIEYIAGYPGTGIGGYALAGAGSGYHAEDVLTVAVGTGGTFRVATVNGSGVITGLEQTAYGTGYSVANTQATTVAPAGGTAATINITSLAPGVPNGLKQAVMFLAAHWYENRELVAPGLQTTLPKTAEYLIGSFRIVALA